MFDAYWKHKMVLKELGAFPRPVLRWYPTDGCNEVDRLYIERLGRCRRILDIGAGDLRIKAKFVTQGYRGEYKTLDLSRERAHDFYAIEEVTGQYDGIMLLDVIEHLELEAFYRLLDRIEALLEPGGTIVISTPNPACISPMWAGDMTHIQQYPLHDLVALFRARGYVCEAFRVILTAHERFSLRDRFRLLIKKVLTHYLGVDYADNILVIATKEAP